GSHAARDPDALADADLDRNADPDPDAHDDSIPGPDGGAGDVRPQEFGNVRPRPLFCLRTLMIHLLMLAGSLALPAPSLSALQAQVPSASHAALEAGFA